MRQTIAHAAPLHSGDGYRLQSALELAARARREDAAAIRRHEAKADSTTRAAGERIAASLEASAAADEALAARIEDALRIWLELEAPDADQVPR